MSSDPAGAVPARAPQDGGAGTELCVLLACFAGPKQAAQDPQAAGQADRQGGDTVLDQVVLKVNAKHKALVYDPRRTLAGTLTPALTWGIFGLLAGGLQGLAVWAVLGAVCGGLYAYYTEHLLTKDELKRIGGRLPGNSSAIVAFVRGTDPRRVLSATASFEPATASAAAIGADLSAQAYSGASNPLETSATPAGAAPTAATDQAVELSMLVVRFVGEHAARQALGNSGSARHQDQKAPQVELVIETNEHGRRRVDRSHHGKRRLLEERHDQLGALRPGVGGHRGLRRRRRGPQLHRERAGHRHPLGPVRRGRRRPVRPVGGARRVCPAAEGARPARPARHLPGGRLGGRPAEPGNDRAVGRARVAAADPALQPGGARRRAGGVRTR